MATLSTWYLTVFNFRGLWTVFSVTMLYCCELLVFDISRKDWFAFRNRSICFYFSELESKWQPFCVSFLTWTNNNFYVLKFLNGVKSVEYNSTLCFNILTFISNVIVKPEMRDKLIVDRIRYVQHVKLILFDDIIDMVLASFRLEGFITGFLKITLFYVFWNSYLLFFANIYLFHATVPSVPLLSN